MGRSWTRLHEHLGLPPGPITYEMVKDAVEDKLAESEDLDWKEQLPAFPRTPGVWNEFAKDVAAMANTRGGLLIYGVSDDIDLVGLDLDTVNEQQLRQTVRNAVQPYITGIDVIPLRAPSGTGPDVLVVDVPASPAAPHVQVGWETKDKDRATFNAPYRVRDETVYMTEHQLARAYQERFTRQETAEALLRQRLAEATDTVLAESANGHAWLIVAALPTRPAPRLMPATTREEARQTLTDALKLAPSLNGPFAQLTILGDSLDGNPRVGLRRWWDSNFLVPDRRDSTRGVMVELHHDGSAVLCADLTWNGKDNGGAALDALTLAKLAGEAVALFETFRRRRTPDSPLEVSATIAVHSDEEPPPRLRLYDVPVSSRMFLSNMRQPRRIVPALTEIPSVTDTGLLQGCAYDLESGLLHQFGYQVQPR